MESATIDRDRRESMIPENETSIAVTDHRAPELETRNLKPETLPSALRGAVLVLIQFDVCEEIKLDQLRQIFGARTLEQPSFKHPTPGYVRYQRPPVVEPIEPLVLETGERLEGQIKYYDYGVLSVVFELPFSGDWDTLVRLGSRWVWDIDFERHASKIAHQKLQRAAPALVKPYPEWLSEDYFIFHVREIPVRRRPPSCALRKVGASRKLCAERSLNFLMVNATRS